MKALNFSQQSEIFNPNQSHRVTVIGVGSVGSQVVYTLAKMGVEDITVYDGDGVESHNIPMSIYGPDDIGLFKVRALQERVQKETGVTINAIDSMYTGEQLKGAVIMCVDNMEARALVWKEVEGNPIVDIFIDTRTAKELISVFAINPCDPKDMDYYKKFLYPSSEAVMQNCGEHGLFLVSVYASAAACSNLINWWKNGKKKQNHKELCLAIEEV